MSTAPRRRYVAAAVLVGLGLLVALVLLLLKSQSTAPPAAAAPAPGPDVAVAALAPGPDVAAAAPAPGPDAAAEGAAVDGGWPRASTTTSGASLILYQPQVASWVDQRDIVLYAAVSYTPMGAQKAAIGTIKAESATEVSTEQRLVSFSDFRIIEANFSTLEPAQLRTVVDEIKLAVPLNERVIALDRVLANLDESQVIPKNVEGVKADPPPIFFSTTPALLLNVDGEPIWSNIKGNDLQYAVNTNWDLFLLQSTQTLYLRTTDTWLAAAALQGPWSYAGTLPDSFGKLPNDPNWKETKAALPGKKLTPETTPTVFAATTPAELMLLSGPPNYQAVEGTAELLWVSNTDSDVFRMTPTGSVYFLVAGRWFSAPDFNGPWTFASSQLPDDFEKIPLEHPRSRVLASVPGTREAAEAVLLAQIPETASVSKSLKAPTVAYQGEPEFQPIEKTSVQRAVNTDKDILKVGDLYYMCFQGVWFMSTSSTGPWAVTGDVPKVIYEIPVSSPSYSVTYVTVQSTSPTTVVYAASPAYLGVMVAWGCVVWGTGYRYPPYVRYGPYPVYHAHYPTYGHAAAYNPWTGAYAHGAAAYGPYGGAGAGARYNPATGAYSRGAAAYGPYGAAGVKQSYNPRTGAYGATAQGANAYGSWGSTSVQRGNQWANTQRSTNNMTGVTTRTTQSSRGVSASKSGPNGRSTVAVSNSGDLYAGHDGNVYKKGDNGNWQKNNGGNWEGVQQPAQRPQASAPPSSRQDTQPSSRQGAAASSRQGAAASSDTLNRVQSDSAARASGAQRTKAYGGASGGNSYRPSGGRGGRR